MTARLSVAALLAALFALLAGPALGALFQEPG